jgi:hypothetical protein
MTNTAAQHADTTATAAVTAHAPTATVTRHTQQQLHARRGAAASAEAAAALALIDERLMSALRRIARVERLTVERNELARLQELVARTYSAA